MAAEIIIDTTSQETRVALTENGSIAELYVERSKDKGVVGNIYRGKILKIVPGIQAAFIDIGLEKAAFLQVSDLFALPEEGDADTCNKDEEAAPKQPIEEVLQEGQELVVQISKEPISTKGARVTAQISLPGRQLVYMPAADHLGVSRRIEDEQERARLRGVVDQIKPAKGGLIVRTVAEGACAEELSADLNYLTALWAEVEKREKETTAAPCLLHSDLDVTLKVVRDVLNDSVERIVVDSKDEYDKLVRFIGTFMPKAKCTVELHEGEPIFDRFGLEVEINRALGKKVWLKSGGYIIIEQTEALTAIDVNSGRYVGKHSLEETSLLTNLEAVKEVAYQLRLRNLGGIIIIDFIDMEKEVNREKVHAALEEALKSDRAKTNVLKISELGLVQMSRKRVRESLGRTLCEPCPYCDGKGHVKSKLSICHEIVRDLHREMREVEGDKVLLTVHPQVADLLYDEERKGIEALEAAFDKRITVRAKPGFHQEQYEVAVM